MINNSTHQNSQRDPGHANAEDQLYPTSRESEDPLAKRRDLDSTERMIRPGFLDIESRQNLIELAGTGWPLIVWPDVRTRWCC